MRASVTGLVVSIPRDPAAGLRTRVYDLGWGWLRGSGDLEPSTMRVALLESLPKSRLKALLDHFGQIEDPREPWRVAHPLPEVLLLVVCGTICDCEDYDLIAEWGEEHLAVLRQYQPYYHGVPGGRWLTQLMNRINPGLFAAAFT